MSKPPLNLEENKPLDKLLADILRAAGIKPEDIESAPQLPEQVETEQLQTYAGTSDHSSIVDQLADKEEARNELKEERDKLKFDLEQQKFNERYDLHELRRTYTPYLFYMTVAWLVFVAILVSLSAAGFSKLTDPVLIALITTTTANVVGLFVIAARWLFPSKNK